MQATLHGNHHPLESPIPPVVELLDKLQNCGAVEFERLCSTLAQQLPKLARADALLLAEALVFALHKHLGSSNDHAVVSLLDEVCGSWDSAKVLPHDTLRSLLRVVFRGSKRGLSATETDESSVRRTRSSPSILKMPANRSTPKFANAALHQESASHPTAQGTVVRELDDEVPSGDVRLLRVLLRLIGHSERGSRECDFEPKLFPQEQQQEPGIAKDGATQLDGHSEQQQQQQQQLHFEQNRKQEQQKEEQEHDNLLKSPNKYFFDVVYSAECKGFVDHEVQDLLIACEVAPSAHGLLQVQSIHKVKTESDWQRDRLLEWEHHIRKLQTRAEDQQFPKPSWRLQEGSSPREQREREEVWWHLLSISSRRPEQSKVWTAPIFHGCPSIGVAESIFRSGFATNVQRTSGWFGEGVYMSTSGTYGSRYALQMKDFWDCPGQTGVIVAGKVAFCEVYPVTQADNKDPLRPMQPGLKGKRIAGAPGASGCDAHFVCVRRHPPNDDHSNFTYHACEEGFRPDGTELVVNQEVQLLPQYIVCFKVQNDDRLCRQVRMAAETWGRSLCSLAASASLPTSTNATSDVKPACTSGTRNYKNDLQTIVASLLKRPVKDGDIVYTERTERNEFVSTVRVQVLNSQCFTGEAQPRRVAAQQSAAEAAKAALHVATDASAALA